MKHSKEIVNSLKVKTSFLRFVYIYQKAKLQSFMWIVLTLFNNIFRQGTEKLHCVHLCFFCTWPLKDMFHQGPSGSPILVVFLLFSNRAEDVPELFQL